MSIRWGIVASKDHVQNGGANSPEESPAYLLWQVNMLWQRLIKRALDPLDITHARFVLLAALACLSKERDSVTQFDIATHRQDRPIWSFSPFWETKARFSGRE